VAAIHSTPNRADLCRQQPSGHHLYLRYRSVLAKSAPDVNTSSTFPRIYTLNPDDVSLSTSNLNAFAFTITGANLPCSAVAASCNTSVKFTQASNTYTASCTGAAAGVTLNCTINLGGISLGATQAVVKVGANSLTIPVGSFLGGFNVF